MEYQVWVKGEYVPRSEAKLSFADRGFRVSDAVFDTARTFNGAVFRLRDHIERLYRSLQYLRIDPGMTMEEMEELTLDVVKRNEAIREPDDDYFITQFITRGQGLRVTDAKEPTIVIWLNPITWGLFAPLYKSGAHLVIPRVRSYSPDELDPKIKHFSRLNFVLAELEATDVDPDAFALPLDQHGNVTEAVNAGNVFVMTDGVLRTPSDRNILQGVSRMTVLELAKQLGIPTSEEDLQPYDLYTADEAFLSNSNHCILPVGRADNRPIGKEAPGPVTNQLLAAWSEMVGLDIVGQITNRARVEASRAG